MSAKKFTDFSPRVREAIDRLAAKSGKTREQIIAAFARAARGEAVNATSLFLA